MMAAQTTYELSADYTKPYKNNNVSPSLLAVQHPGAVRCLGVGRSTDD